MTLHVQFTLACALALTGCAQSPDVVVKPVQVVLPVECTSPDPKFPVLPDRDVTWKDAVRDREHAEDAFDDVIELRRVCRSAILAGRISIKNQ